MEDVLARRFWSKVERGPDCWLWQGGKVGPGYGAIKVDGRMERAHRVAWFLEHGSWPERQLRHVCENPGCVRPEHIVEEGQAPKPPDRRRPRGSGHLQRRGDSWRIVVTAGTDPATGAVRRVTRTLHVATELEARAELTRVLAEVQAGNHDTSGKHTFGELLDAWLNHAIPNLEPGTAALYGYAAGYVTPALRGKDVTRLTAEDLDALYRWLLTHGSTGNGRAAQGGKPLAAKSVKQVHSVIHLALAQGRKWKWVTSNVAEDATSPSPRKRQATPPTTDALAKLLEFISDHDPTFSLFLRVAATAGPRRGEMCAIRWPAVDLQRGTLQVLRRIVWNNAEHRWEERESTKTGRDRVLVLGPRTLELMRAHRAQMEERAKEAGVTLGDGSYIFSDATDCSVAWSPQRVTRKFGAARRAAGLGPECRLHDLRAFLSTQLQEGGHPLPVVSGRLGHSQFSTTLDHYTGWMPKADRAAAEYMDAVIDQGGPGPASGGGT